MNTTIAQELNILEAEKESFSDGIHQALEALDTLKRLAGKSVIARDFEITAYVLKDALLRTNSHISELKNVIIEATFEVSCPVCGKIAEMRSYEEAVNCGEEHRRQRNNLHLCVVIEK